MKKDYNERDPERDIFKAALGAIPIEPSERFWNSALNGIIDKQNVADKKQIRLWKAVSISLGIVIVLLCLHDYTVSNRIDTIEKKITEVTSNGQNSVAIKQNTNSAAANNTQPQANNAIANNQSNSVSVSQARKGQRNNFLKPPHNHAVLVAGNGGNVPIQQNNLVVVNNTNASTANVQNQQPVVANSQSATSTTALNSNNQVNNITDNTKTDIGTGNVKNNVDSKEVVEVKSETKDSAQVTANKTDSASFLPPLNQEPKNTISFRHRLSFSAFFAPGSPNDFLADRDGNTNDNISINDLKERETDWFAYQVGGKVGFDISNRLTIHTGIYYNINSYNIKETVITAQSQSNGETGYSIVTSSGVVNIPYTGPTPHQGDSMKVGGSSARGYICIPLQLTYMFATHNKLGFYVIGGMSADIATYKSTSLHWQNTSLQEGQVTVESVQGLQTLHYGYNIGFGATYKLGKGFSVYAEPYIQGSITSINQNTPIVTYPFFFGCAFGLTYHL